MPQEIYNFGAGPAVLPKPVLAQVQEELPDWHGSGMSVMEMSHRGREYMGIIAQAEADLRTLLAIPENYRVLFLQGGASQQFAMVPMNLLAGGRAAYVETGIWSRKASSEARRFGEIDVIASNATAADHAVPRQESWQLRPEHRYCHIADNETIDGIEFDFIPELGEVPLVSDASSNILSKPLDVSRFGLIYAGAQKNIGPAGLTLVIVREDLLGKAGPQVPTMLNYAVHAENASMYNTPPTFAIYVAGLVFRWLLQQGGLPAMAEINARKATALYAAIDGSEGFYRNDVATANRSRMNVPFFLRDSRLDGEFLQEAGQRGLLQLKGHRLLSGMRASIYNAMPEAGVRALVDFLHDFAHRHG
ncbi:3-phosphoserine/phosphohydroxythreonine transaminase [Acidithiobacillus sp. CV18-2]|uniref:Phosphoserine aminotransferase n=1 Tax=Igneacidithiobacillus copahuensis TaxID=2724909 RepID=A0AAE2YMR8_9PROT|nr:3-phosphoserine/phosphohydroxythreonine transaminase [Igneacidithiobacillus copahuensis]MBU2754274.1 3-phosphoserine/phosphohydroxythreonine transaminase [Acidithiobacillus sp. CV18-3]MBU2757400.1 3-phosphoserine/phosphohydroxythreonine transaminase [Acidithiobacillus sp. BN09-2]MBU2778161.1 3-phosphoserine/phosphohydroxythreonine transaminase [Acidithiobacillus sp. CV18-2]MBU2796487.1 3-phosphoserine/phosphohydroxythreonine transaminase [Acidithiobacillus sp. VAN18-2]MBU2800113.1 3-phospho